MLDAAWRNLAHPETLAGLTHLRGLGVTGCSWLTSLDWSRGLTRLRRIALGLSGVSDLTPLVRLPALEVVDAQGDMNLLGGEPRLLASLAPGEWPAMKTLRILGSRIPEEAVEAFQRLHPACEVAWSGMEELRRALAGVDRFRVRSGGTCCRHRRTEETLFETRSPREIDDFLGLLRFRVPEFDGACQCSGSPTLEFYAGRDLRAAVSVHHGYRLRWAGGAWPGDAELVLASAEAMADWLAARGDFGPRGELDWARRDEEARRHQTEREAALLPPSLRTRYADVERRSRPEEEVPAFREAVPDASARVLLALRLLGAKARFAREAGASWAARLILDGEAPTEVVAVAPAAIKDAEVCRGLGRWLGPRLSLGHLPIDGLERVLPGVVSAFLEDPSRDVQQEGVLLAADVGRPETTALLLRYVEGPATRVLGLGASADPWARNSAKAGVEALIETGDPEGAERVRELAVGWPGLRDGIEARIRRVAREIELLPGGLRDAVRAAERSRASLSAVLDVAVPELSRRVVLAFRLMANAESRWASDCPAAAGRDVLEHAPRDLVIEAAQKAMDDPEVAAGVG